MTLRRATKSPSSTASLKTAQSLCCFHPGIPADSETSAGTRPSSSTGSCSCGSYREKGFLDNQRKYLQQRLQAPERRQRSSCKRPCSMPRLCARARPGNHCHISGCVPVVPTSAVACLPSARAGTALYGEALDIADNAFQKPCCLFEWGDGIWTSARSRNGKEVPTPTCWATSSKFVNRSRWGVLRREDITEYISKNTIIPALLGKVRAEHRRVRCPGLALVARRTVATPTSTRHAWGVDIPYPPEISNGLDTEAPDLLARRKPWNKARRRRGEPATEIWREPFARHQRTREVRARLTAR